MRNNTAMATEKGVGTIDCFKNSILRPFVQASQRTRKAYQRIALDGRWLYVYADHKKTPSCRWRSGSGLHRWWVENGGYRMTDKTKATRGGRQLVHEEENRPLGAVNKMPINTNQPLVYSTTQCAAVKDWAGYFDCSFALRRWRYSTSRFNAAVTNCPVLSPGIFTASTLFITSCGTLAATVCDFAFTAFVAMWCTPSKKQMQYAGKKISVQHLTCLTPCFRLVFNTLLVQGAETTKPGSARTHTGLLTTNDR